MTPVATPEAPEGFRHEALLYAGERRFLEGTTAFVREGLARDEAVMVVVDADKIGPLRHALGADARGVRFEDMGAIGANPARIIPAWKDFVDETRARGRHPRGVGEPIGPQRGPAELVECQIHEALLNVAFADEPPWRLLCPYDTTALHQQVVAHAWRTHPYVRAEDGRVGGAGPAHVGPDTLDGALPEPASEPIDLAFDLATLPRVRGAVAAAAFGVVGPRTADLALATHEIAANSIRHGGGRGRLRMWPDAETFVCEVRDAGRIVEPLVGRSRPAPSGESGRGVWLANQLCDLVQVRSSAEGSTVRLHVRRRHHDGPTA
jgi:anti-sigma regulatory factor (Ser/Thr protein kinase)